MVPLACAGAVLARGHARSLLLRRRRRRQWPVLLIPYPGGDGRVAMLQRLIQEMPVEFAVLLPHELSHRYGWTRLEVGEENFLCYERGCGQRSADGARARGGSKLAKALANLRRPVL